MRIANLAGRAVLVAADDSGLDVATASSGEFGPGLRAVYDHWEAFVAWAATLDLATGDVPIAHELLGPPSPEPRQVFAIGLNYGAHAAESGFERPDRLPPTFTKFVTSFSGPVTTVTLPPGGNTDWEIELVVVIGSEAHEVAADAAWQHVAGLTAGQDLSERASQLAGPAPQFGLAKSFPGFTPMGPWLVTPDGFDDPTDLALSCTLDGETVQDGRTGDLLFPVDELIAGLSRVVTLLPGDVIFTGTPSGVGMGRTPPRYIRPGEVLESRIEGIGTLRQTFAAAATG